MTNKSSDEILQELFGLCQQKQFCESVESDQDCESIESQDSKNMEKKKHKRKKKKKHKKTKKRHRSASTSSYDSESNLKLKKKKIKLSDKPNESETLSNLSIQIKKEEGDSTLEQEDRKPNLDELTKNYRKDSSGVKKITFNDVFNTITITTQRELLEKIKKESKEPLLKPNQIKKEKLDSYELSKTLNTLEVPEKKEVMQEKKPTEIFKIEKAEIDNFAKSTTKPKKITIKNLKNSAVYEATIKEVEEKEKLSAEKHEDGELSSNSKSSDLNSVETEIKGISNFNDSELHIRERLKSHDKSKEIHRFRSHKSKRHHKDVKNHKSQKKQRSTERIRHRSKSPDARHYNQHNRTGSLNARSKPKSPSQRNRRSTVGIKERSHSRSRSRSRRRTKSNHRRSKSKSVERIDKLKLLEIARKNAISLLQQGTIPTPAIVNTSKITSIKAGGKTVDELTNFCKQLSKKEAQSDNCDDSTRNLDSDEEKSMPFHHPFQLKERPSSIVMNIRNSIPLPTKTAQEKTVELSKQLSLQYPVSSGQQHRKTENVWVPVEKTQESVTSKNTKTVNSVASMNGSSNTSYSVPAVVSYPNPGNHSQTVAPDNNSIIPPHQNIDISSIVAQRLEAIRRLSENPQDPIGTNLIQAVDSKMTVWAESKVQPGLFTGSTGVKPLSAAELSGGYHAWPKKNLFTSAKPVSSDKGEALMKKMGWQPGEGLGKYKQGPSVPCEINMKTDRKGLAEQPPVARAFNQPNAPKPFEIDHNKHPVSILNEYCSRKKIPTPLYECEEKEGTARRKLYLFSVTVNGFKYTPSKPSTNKKQSKLEAATLCLQTLGILSVVPPSI